MNTIPDATKSCKESLSQLVERLLAGNPPNGAKPEDYGDHEQVARDLIDAAPAGPETVRRVAGVWAEEDVYAFLLPPEEERDGGAWQPFPLDTLPDAVAGYARAASRAIPADPAFVAMPMLAVLSAAIGAKARIQLKRGWEEPPTIWTMLVAPSGSSKSPALQYALRPVYRLEAHERDVYEHKRTAYERAKEGGEKAEKPVRRRYRTGDATVESVVSVLSENPHGILLARDELAAWIGSFDRYANGAADLQAWIEMHGGLQVSTDRKTSGNVTIDRPAVAVTGTIQPGTLRDKIGEIHFDTGFAARLLMAQPPVQPKEWTEADVARETDEAYETLLQRLYEFEPLQLTLTQAAKEKWIRFVNDHGQRVYEMAGGVRKTITSKEEMHAARLALVIQLSRWAAGEAESSQVDAKSMAGGIRLATWLRAETLRVFDVLELDRMAMPPEEQMLSSLPEQFTTQQAYDAAYSNGADVTERTVRNWLEALQHSGKLRKIKRGYYAQV